MEGTGAGLSCVLQNLPRKLSAILDELERMQEQELVSLELDFSKAETASFLTRAINPLWPLQRLNLLTLEISLSEIAAVLQDAERRQLNEIAVRAWLRKLKDAVYETEERLDKIVIEVLAVKAKKRYISSLSIATISSRLEREMQELLMNRFRLITKEMKDFGFKEGFVETQPPISITRQTSSWSYVIESEVNARECEKKELIDPLINFENEEEVPSVLPVVGVGVGMGGIGKTTLARLVFHDERIIAHFDLRMWVSVTKAVSDVPSLVKKILESAVGAYVYHPSSSSSDPVLQTQLQEKLRGKRYLFISTRHTNSTTFMLL